MKFYDAADTSLDIEQHITRHTLGYKTIEEARESKSKGSPEFKNIYEIEITVTQVEPKL